MKQIVEVLRVRISFALKTFQIDIILEITTIVEILTMTWKIIKEILN